MDPINLKQWTLQALMEPSLSVNGGDPTDRLHQSLYSPVLTNMRVDHGAVLRSIGRWSLGVRVGEVAKGCSGTQEHLQSEFGRVKLQHAMDMASPKGFVGIFCWWKKRGPELRYTVHAMNEASRDGNVPVLRRWKKSWLELRYTEYAIDEGDSLLFSCGAVVEEEQA
ncbi:hypothetical protein BJ742DRAFT_745934 [Cladochytrium replicatum]|nr:hypothetical protein BJ742DRAFT_745934 [Cladochytrium replicatum]